MILDLAFFPIPSLITYARPLQTVAPPVPAASLRKAAQHRAVEASSAGVTHVTRQALEVLLALTLPYHTFPSLIPTAACRRCTPSLDFRRFLRSPAAAAANPRILLDFAFHPLPSLITYARPLQTTATPVPAASQGKTAQHLAVQTSPAGVAHIASKALEAVLAEALP